MHLKHACLPISPPERGVKTANMIPKSLRLRKGGFSFCKSSWRSSEKHGRIPSPNARKKREVDYECNALCLSTRTRRPSDGMRDAHRHGLCRACRARLQYIARILRDAGLGLFHDDRLRRLPSRIRRSALSSPSPAAAPRASSGNARWTWGAPWRRKIGRAQDDPHYQSPTTSQETICGESAFREGRGSQKYAKRCSKRRSKKRRRTQEEVRRSRVPSTGDWGQSSPVAWRYGCVLKDVWCFAVVDDHARAVGVARQRDVLRQQAMVVHELELEV